MKAALVPATEYRASVLSETFHPGFVGLFEAMEPGAHVIVIGVSDADVVLARSAGFHVRDTLLVFFAGPRAQTCALLRKPLSEATVAEQVMATGTSALNIDACRIGAGGDGEGGRWPTNLLILHTPECKRTGTEKVPGHKGYPNGPGGKSYQYSSDKRGAEVRPNAWAGHADADGMETIDVWECSSTCPKLALDALSGDLHARGNVTPTKRRQSNGVTGWGVGPDGEVDPGDAGGASKFFPQFADMPGLMGWLTALITPS